MSAPGKPRRPAALLPPDHARDRPLFAVAAILVFLASLAGFGAAGAWQAAEGWTAQLSSELTVQLIAHDARDADADAVDAAAQIARLPGVIEATARSRADAEALLRPWLGGAGLPDDLPVPRLIAVRIDPDAPPAPGAIEALLGGNPYEVVVDDHARWEAAVQRSAGTVRYFALGLVAILALAAGAVIAFAARASLAARWDVAEALHLVGAPDRFVTGIFQRRFFFLGLKAGLAGAGLAALAGYALAHGAGAAGAVFFLPVPALGWTAAAIAPGAALASALIAALAARLAVTGELKARWP